MIPSCNMYSWCFIVTVFCVCANVISSPVIQCKLTDTKCLDNLGPAIYTMFFDGDPSIGTEDLDPMHVDTIDGNLTNLKFKLTDNTVIGLKDCVTENVKLNLAVLGLHATMTCPSLKMHGKYDMHGELVKQPVEGTGNYSITTNTYLLSVDVEMKVLQGKNGKSHIAIKNFRLKADPIEPVVFDFKNLFNGKNEELASAMSKLANEKWKVVATELQDPVFYAFFRKIIKNANKYLKTIAVEELVKLN